MKAYLIILGFYFPSLIFSQNIFQGKIVNSNKEPLSYASIAYYNHKRGVTADTEGNFIIPVYLGDSIKLSAIGYISKTFTIQSGQQPTTFVLQENYKQLENIVVTTRRRTSKKIILGHYQKDNTLWDWFGYPTQAAVFIPNTNHTQGYIDQVLFKLGEHTGKQFLLRIRLLTRDSITGMPSKDLLYSDNILQPSSLKRINRFYLNDKTIELPPNGIFVSFEWIVTDQSFDHNKNPPFVLGNMNAGQHYIYTNFKEMGWIKSGWSAPSYNGFPVPNISIVIAY